MSKKGSIYGLIDPRNNMICYVGQTICTLDVRLYQHIASPTSKDSAAWIAELKAEGLKPRIVLLETVPVGELDEAERRWIVVMIERGCNLLNFKVKNSQYNRTAPRNPSPAVKARRNFGDIIARAGLTRPELAEAANISARTLDSLANPTAAKRQGMARAATAWKIARGYAQLQGITPEQAFDTLFEREEVLLGQRFASVPNL